MPDLIRRCADTDSFAGCGDEAGRAGAPPRLNLKGLFRLGEVSLSDGAVEISGVGGVMTVTGLLRLLELIDRCRGDEPISARLGCVSGCNSDSIGGGSKAVGSSLADVRDKGLFLALVADDVCNDECVEPAGPSTA